jgi:hypothetical protein
MGNHHKSTNSSLLPVEEGGVETLKIFLNASQGWDCGRRRRWVTYAQRNII